MNDTYSDTHPKMEALQIGLLRKAPGWRKMEMLNSLNEAARGLALAGLRRRYPGASPDELHRRLADLLLGEVLARKVYRAVEYD
jgi:DNA-binding HxlR family transcriptional regulator